MQKRVAKTLIKPVGNEDFGAPFSKMALKIIKKALPREGFRNAFPERRKPYKTCRISRFSKCKNALRKPL